MKRRKIFIGGVVLFSILLSSFGYYFYQIVYTPNILVDKTDRVIEIPTGTDYKYLQASLYEDDLVQDIVSFSFLARFMEYQENVKPGRYLLKKNMTNVAAIRMLRAGNQTPVNLKINNIRLKTDLVEKISEQLEMDTAMFAAYLDSVSREGTYGFDEKNIVSMFLPNTYQVYWTTSRKKLFDRMKREYDTFWNEERKSKADQMGLTPQQVTTLASITYAESKLLEEAKRISGLYFNRIQRGIPLQADPTLVFALGDFTLERVLNIHKEIDSPYNTYKYAGLPPGPINLPPLSFIDATLNYEKHSYLYMCAKEDFSGYHNFAKDLAQHTRNANLYHAALNRRNR